VVLITTGKNPLQTYHEIFNGTGLNWFFHVGSHEIGVPFSNARVWFPWDTASVSAQNLQQTLILTTTLVLTGLAVAFAFRCGLFNIGGQGQYIVGSIVAVQMGVWFATLSAVPHVLLAVAVASVAGALWGGIAGLLRATVGAHEVITTIMLNWIALWVGSYLVGFGGPMQDPRAISVPVTREVSEGSKLHVFWGFPTLQGLHIGFFIALAALVVYWIVLNRTTLGYEVRAVGFNAEAARYGGINVSQNYFLAMAISGLFAGLAGAMDVLGWQFRLDLTGVQTASQIAFIGIAVALLGRNNAVGVFFASVLFAALINGTSTRNLNPDVFRPELAGNLTRIIQGLVVLFVGADLLILYLWQLRRKMRPARAKAVPQE
jgi:general nucleoside transport system permease protein